MAAEKKNMIISSSSPAEGDGVISQVVVAEDHMNMVHQRVSLRQTVSCVWLLFWEKMLGFSLLPLSLSYSCTFFQRQSLVCNRCCWIFIARTAYLFLITHNMPALTSCQSFRAPKWPARYTGYGNSYRWHVDGAFLTWTLIRVIKLWVYCYDLWLNVSGQHKCN